MPGSSRTSKRRRRTHTSNDEAAGNISGGDSPVHASSVKPKAAIVLEAATASTTAADAIQPSKTNTGRVIEPPRCVVIRDILPPVAGVVAMCATSDGKLLAAARADGTIDIWVASSSHESSELFPSSSGA